MSGYIKTFRIKEGKNKLISFLIDDEKLLEKLFRLRFKIFEKLN